MTGILIAGGKSTRMGANKALLPYGDVPMAVHMVQLLKSVSPDVIAIVNDEKVKAVLDVPCYSDIVPGAGPLGGLHAACRHSPTERFLTVPCDTPFVTPGLLASLLRFEKFGSIVVPYSGGRVHPLIGIYTRSLEVRLKRRLDDGMRSMHAFLKSQYPVEVHVDEEESGKLGRLANLNTKLEYDRCAAQRGGRLDHKEIKKCG